MTNQPQQGASELTREKVERCLERFMDVRDRDGQMLAISRVDAVNIIALCEHYLSTTAVAPAGAEPVAYRSRLRGHGRWVLTENAGEGHPDVECEPLYTAQPNWRESLEALAAKWHKRAKMAGVHYAVIDECADELLEALAAQTNSCTNGHSQP